MHKLYRDRLSQLIAAPSVSCHDLKWDMSNHKVCVLLAQWLEPLGFKCEIQAVSGETEKYNLIAVKGSGPGGLVLAGHTDTVPCNPERWDSDPFKLLESNNRFYGLGATDMKGFFPAVLAALELTKNTPLQQPIFILGTADEESSMCGARAIAQQGYPKARYAVIGEPTGLRPIHMHKGIIFESIKIIGKAGHSSNPALGNNALEIMNEVISDLLLYRQHLQSNYSNPGFEVAVPTMNLGCIHGGDNPNRICGSCELQFDLRPVPGMELDNLRSDIKARALKIIERSGAQVEFTSLFPGVSPYEQDKNSDIVKLAEKLSGHQAEAVGFATEAPFLKSMGMETIVLGPGNIDQAHKPNEYIEHSQIEPAVDLIANLIRKLCVIQQ